MKTLKAIGYILWLAIIVLVVICLINAFSWILMIAGFVFLVCLAIDIVLDVRRYKNK